MTTSSQNADLRAAWFGQVSPAWKLGRAKNAFRVVSKKVGTRSSEYALLSLTLKGIIPRDLDSGKGKFPESFDTYQEVKKGDIVFCLFDIDETPRTVGLSDLDGMVTGAYTVVRCTELVDPRFVTYFYLSIDERKGLRPFYTGLRKVVRTETFLNAAFPLPDLATQRQIADFLDRETARIDLLIEKKQRFLHVLSEKVSATIEMLVIGKTGPGSAPHAEVQADKRLKRDEWTLTPVKRVATIRGGYAFSSDDFTDTGVQLIRIGNLYENSLQLDRQAVFLPERYLSDYSEFEILEGDILMSLTGTLGKRDYGFSVLVGPEKPLLLNQRVARIRSNHLVANTFLLLALRTNFYLDQLYALPSGTKQANLSNDDVLNVKIPLPPLAEQKSIVQKVHKFVSPLEALSQKTNASINRLKEYRSALITAAVTGQIDVQTRGGSGIMDRRLDEIQEEMEA
ncbi:restriction endonuclease subunit S [Leisingera aquimarina]|uniref:restriction endonuclease subunit S n=1 Tax=Leisingera aquimarina TaxID=476529 RepID=UPI00041B8011|nr:restriction endonuclease subunit S [Leisingera aquimarina]